MNQAAGGSGYVGAYYVTGTEMEERHRIDAGSWLQDVAVVQGGNTTTLCFSREMRVGDAHEGRRHRRHHRRQLLRTKRQAYPPDVDPDTLAGFNWAVGEYPELQFHGLPNAGGFWLEVESGAI